MTLSSLQQLKEITKLKVLLEGETGTGKTHTAVEVAMAFARNGKTVLYIDTEQGAGQEIHDYLVDAFGDIEKGIEAVGNHFEYRVAITPDELINALKDAPRYDLVVLDSYYPLVQDNIRLYVRDLYLKQGYYKIGEKRIEIENPETFTLSGFMYQLANEYEKKIFEALLKSKTNFLFTTKPMPAEKSDKRNWLYGFFDIILRLYLSESGSRMARVVKIRGRRLNQVLYKQMIQDYKTTLLKLFRRSGQIEKIPGQEEGKKEG